MSAVLENTVEDIEVLDGATIERIWLAPWDDGFDRREQGVVRLTVRYKRGLIVNGSDRGDYELWQDPEGNGPGFLSFVESGKPIPA